MAKGDDIQGRLVNFGVGIIRLTDTLPRSYAGNHIAGQLLRSGTSPAPNYSEARGAESLRDFVHKLAIVQKELNETYIWLIMLQKSDMPHKGNLPSLIEECDQLCRIIGSSRKTSKQKLNDYSTREDSLPYEFNPEDYL
jgi:four helix bundle protein